MYVHRTTVINWQGEPSTTKNSSSSRAPKNAALSSENCRKLSETWALTEIMSTSNVRTALREAATRSIDCAHFSILRNGEQTPQGSSSPQRGKYVNSSKALEEHVSTVEPSEVHAGSPEKSNTLYSTGNTQTPE